MRRSFTLVILLLSAASPAAGMENWTASRRDVADCTWQPFPLFTTAYVQAPGPKAGSERLYLRKEPTYAPVLPSTAPFEWLNHECSLWPGMRLRVASWGRKKDPFAKVYYNGGVYWVSKLYRNGDKGLVPIASATSAIPQRQPPSTLETDRALVPPWTD